MIRDCAQFDTWLDGGRDASLAASANAHADGCARCAGALELEALLAEPPSVAAGPAFTEGVLFRVRDAERARAAARLVLSDDEPAWWLRAPAEPGAALALTVAALLAWRGDGLWSLAMALSRSARAHDWTRGPGSGVLDTIGNAFSGLVSGTFASGTTASAVLLTVLVGVLAVASWVLCRAIERLVANAALRPSPALRNGMQHAR
jgi:hypothetical protein